MTVSSQSPQSKHIDYSDLVVNVLPCRIKYNGEENLDFWKRSNTKFNGEVLIEPIQNQQNQQPQRVNEAEAETEAETETEAQINPDHFYPVYKESKIQQHSSNSPSTTNATTPYRAYFRGRKFLGERLNLTKPGQPQDQSQRQAQGYKSLLLEKNPSTDEAQYLSVKGNINDIILWEHEKFASDSLKVEHNFQNQWFDVEEMIRVSLIIHE